MPRGNDDIIEDIGFLTEQLLIIKQSCDDYDDEGAYAAFDRLKTKKWKKDTTAFLEEIKDTLYLFSDFGKVVDRISSYLGGA